jgi:V8-like Glu-specific endopeptidase
MTKTKNPQAMAALFIIYVLTDLFPGAFAQQVVQEGGMSVLNNVGAVDYRSAKAMPLPIASGYTNSRAQQDNVKALTTNPTLPQAAPGFSPGGVGTSAKDEINLGASFSTGDNRAPPLEFGTRNLPFSTSRADLNPASTNEQYPFRATGKLFFVIGSDTYNCSASLIKPGIVVTAAHCVAEFGKQRYYANWQFVPGYRNGVAPYGTWTVAQARVLDSYYKGTDTCAQAGVVCENDIAVLVLSAKKGADGNLYYPGTATGWYAVGWNRARFTGQGITHITQIGYPLCLDDGAYMQRNDSQGVISSDFSGNTIIGSLMCGGSSGGPWLINFGVRPTLSGTLAGAAAEPNQIIGVTSWGSTDDAVKFMGASPFRDGNLPTLVNAVCTAFPDACK